MHAEIADRKDEIAALCQRYGVQRLDLFGSASSNSCHRAVPTASTGSWGLRQTWPTPSGAR